MSEEALLKQHHHKTLLALTIIFVGIGLLVILRPNSDEKYRKALEETITARFQTFGNAAQAQGHVVDYAEIAKLTKAEMAPELLAEIKRQNGVINQLTAALAKVDGKIEDLKPLTLMERKPDGSFKTTLEQNRGNLPSLASVSLDYSPLRVNPLIGKWTSNTETFSMKFTKWTGENGGFRSAAQLERTVTTPDGTKAVEPIQIVSNDAFFLKDDLQNVAPFPRYTLFVGGAVDATSGKTNPSFYVQKHITRRFSITTGYVNKGYLLGGAYSFGKQ